MTSIGLLAWGPLQHGHHENRLREFCCTVDRSAGTIAIQDYDPVELMGRLGEDTWIFNHRAKDNTQIHFDGYVRIAVNNCEAAGSLRQFPQSQSYQRHRVSVNSVTGETVIDIHHFSLNEILLHT